MNQHLSSEQISRWMAGERSSEVEAHVRECPQCGAELARLVRAFSRFRDSGWRWAADCYAAPSTAAKPKPRYRAKLSLAGALAAAVLIAAFAIPRPAPVSRAGEELFVQIPYVEPLAPYERSAVLRMDVPVTALIAAGFEVHAADTGAAIRADVLVGQDGRAHAIRLIPDSIARADRRQEP